MNERFEQAMGGIDAANREDPRTEVVAGKAEPREWLFARRVFDWVLRLKPDASEELLLAARAHTLRRWMIPRDHYAQTTIGYHQWRDALAQFHAEQAEPILREVGYPVDMIEKVKLLITRASWPQSEDARVLEDADCLVFLETKLAGYIDEWGDAKTLRILKRTVRKMTPEGQKHALQLNLSERERKLLEQATR